MRWRQEENRTEQIEVEDKRGIYRVGDQLEVGDPLESQEGVRNE